MRCARFTTQVRCAGVIRSYRGLIQTQLQLPDEVEPKYRQPIECDGTLESFCGLVQNVAGRVKLREFSKDFPGRGLEGDFRTRLVNGNRVNDILVIDRFCLILTIAMIVHG
jgi:hypothetical protein